jgi:Protein of unknown function (DUF1592)/Protein of unknown function (DUF1588)/Protein of unknown function (DUF1595)/Protein of unknown function (DUF1585)/Protein of unknown function (DUF1587)
MPRLSLASGVSRSLALALIVGCSAGKGPNLGPDEAGGTGSTSGATAAGGSGASHGGTAGSGTGSTGSSSATGGNGTGGNGTGGDGAGGNGAGGDGAGGSSAGAAGSGVMPPPSELPAPNACTSSAPGPRKVWRLSAPEFAASVHSIFSDTSGSAPVGAVFSDPIVLGFSVDASTLLVQGLNASQLMDSAEAVAAWAAQNGQLSQFASCTTTDATCAQQFVQGFGRRAFRTTLAASDPRIATYSAIFTAEKTFSDAAQAVISAMLQSPYFIYRSELGSANGGTFALTPYEVATELAYLLTGTMPDDTLLAAADSVAAGQLAENSMIDQQADRLIAADGNNASAVMGFMNGWLGLNRLYTTAKDDTVFALSQALRDDMANESQNLIAEAFNGGGNVGSLLTADHTFLNAELATYYGLDASGLGTDFKSVPLTSSSGRDPGLLATGTILNGYARPDTSSPTQRGHLVRTRMLCQDIAPPPPGVDTTFKPSTQVETTRQHFENEHSVGSCYNCHEFMDWIGFGFEQYDGFGRYRTTDNGLPIDTSVTVFGDPEGNDDALPGLSGPGSLSEFLAGSDDVERCMQRYWTYYAYGSSSWSQDACTYDAIYTEAASGNFALKSVLKAIIHAPNFTSRVQDQ